MCYSQHWRMLVPLSAWALTHVLYFQHGAPLSAWALTCMHICDSQHGAPLPAWALTHVLHPACLAMSLCPTPFIKSWLCHSPHVGWGRGALTVIFFYCNLQKYRKVNRTLHQQWMAMHGGNLCSHRHELPRHRVMAIRLKSCLVATEKSGELERWPIALQMALMMAMESSAAPPVDSNTTRTKSTPTSRHAGPWHM